MTPAITGRSTPSTAMTRRVAGAADAPAVAGAADVDGAADCDGTADGDMATEGDGTTDAPGEHAIKEAASSHADTEAARGRDISGRTRGPSSPRRQSRRAQ